MGVRCVVRKGVFVVCGGVAAAVWYPVYFDDESVFCGHLVYLSRVAAHLDQLRLRRETEGVGGDRVRCTNRDWER